MRKLAVHLTRSPTDSITVGQLAEHDHRIYFEYDPAFLQTRIALSPFKLPAGPELIEHRDTGFGPLPGVFDDSLPDGWGLLLMDRHFRCEGIDPATLSPLDRLAYLGTRTMGALTYHPPHEIDRAEMLLDLHALSQNVESVLEGDAAEVLPQLLRAGGPPGGARPKVLVGIDGERILSGEDDLPEGFEHWIVKFATKRDARHAGPVEYAYALMARDAGIDLPDVRLFEVKKGRSPRRYFGVKRFDRHQGNVRVHVHTFANLLHADFRIPSTDYADLLKVTQALTRHHGDVLRAFRLMVFNVAAHNRDDHGKNFAFLLGSDGEWRLTPAYDLTFSHGPGGEHSMSVRGEGRHPTRDHCLQLAEEVGIDVREAIDAIEAVNTAIAGWNALADEAGCPKSIRSTVASALRRL